MNASKFRFGDIVQADSSGRYVLMANRRYMVVTDTTSGVMARLMPLFDTGDQSRLIKVENLDGLELVERLV